MSKHKQGCPTSGLNQLRKVPASSYSAYDLWAHWPWDTPEHTQKSLWIEV